MAKATGTKAAAGDDQNTTRKKAAAKVTATKAAATRTSAKKAAVKKPATKVAAKKKPAARKAKAPVKAKKAATTVRSKRRTAAAARPGVVAKKQPVTRARRVKPAVLEVSPAVIDTSVAAEVAARLVLDRATAPPADPFHLFTPPPVVGLPRGSSALRHVKEMLHRPVARQLDSVFGPAPVPTATMKRFLRGEKVARTQRVRGTTNFHSGQPSVPHRSVG